MIPVNYQINTPSGPLPLGTPVYVSILSNGAGGCNVAPDPVNPGRYSLHYPVSGPTTIMLVAPGYQPMIWQQDVPPAGPVESLVNDPMVLVPL